VLGSGTKLLIFLVVLHSLFFYAGQNQLMQQKTGDNPHKSFVDEFQKDGSLKSSMDNSTQGSLFSTSISFFSPLFPVWNFVTTLWDIVVSPQSWIWGSTLPTMFQSILSAVMFILEFSMILKIIRGVNL